MIASNFFGGPEKQIVEHGAALDASRWRAVIGSFRENRDEVEVTREAARRGMETFLIDTRSPFSPGAILQLRKRLRELEADLLVTHGYKATVVGAVAAFLERRPHLVVVRGYTGEDRKVRMYEAVDRWFVRRARHVVCVSHGTRKAVLALGVDPERVKTIHNAVRLENAEAAPAGLRYRFGIEGGAPLILTVGRLSPEKGHRFMISALARLKRGGSDAHLVLVGDGREREALEAQSRNEEVSDRVHFAGFRKDVLACMKEADLVVNPSCTEGLPNVILEAFVAGTPVVATDVGGSGELVLPGRTGWLVPRNDPDALSAAVSEVLARVDRGGGIAEAAWKYVQEHFTFPQQAGRLMELYDQAAGGKG